MNSYKPGQSFRTTARCKVLGLLTDLASPAVTMHLPTGGSTAGTPVADSQGVAHCDFVIPMGTGPGIGVYRWQTTGSQPAQNALAEKQFQVEPLDF